AVARIIGRSRQCGRLPMPLRLRSCPASALPNPGLPPSMPRIGCKIASIAEEVIPGPWRPIPGTRSHPRLPIVMLHLLNERIRIEIKEEILVVTHKRTFSAVSLLAAFALLLAGCDIGAATPTTVPTAVPP